MLRPQPFVQQDKSNTHKVVLPPTHSRSHQIVKRLLRKPLFQELTRPELLVDVGAYTGTSLQAMASTLGDLVSDADLGDLGVTVF